MQCKICKFTDKIRSVAHSLLAVVCLTTASLALAQNNDAVDTLIRQGLYAQSIADWTKAKNAWDKVLLSDRNHPDALRGLFYEKLQQGHVEAADQYIEKLSSAEPEHPYLDVMRNDRNRVTESRPSVVEARKQVKSDNIDAGLELYRISFGRVDPNGPLALEFYTTLGGAVTGWEEALTGLKRLADANPDDFSYQLAYSKHLTYSTENRAQGISQLISLASEPASRSSAMPALREAIRWLPNTHENIKLFEKYLTLVDDDAEMERLYTTLKNSRTPAQDRQLQLGFEAMEEDSLERAVQSFKRILRSRPNDADALAGLGLVELRQGKFAQSSSLLSRALKYSGGNRKDWQRALNTARYWSRIETARELVSNKSYAEAMDPLFEAIEIFPTDEVGLVLIAETFYKQGDTDEAEKYYLQAIENNPLNAAALRGLGELYNETDRFDKAQQLAKRLTNNEAGGSDTVAEGIIAQSLVARARAHMKRNEFDLAQVALEDAHRTQPYDPWVALELAQLLKRRKRHDRARLLMLKLEQQEPVSASVLHALAEFSLIDNRYRDALSYLERISVAQRTGQMANTQNRVWMRLQVQRAVDFAQNNEFGRARKTLGEAENFAGSQPDMAGALAAGWVELGEHERALSIMRTALKLDSDVWLQLQYAGLLLKVQKNKELGQVINALQAKSDLDEFQLRELSHIEISLALRKADQYLRDAEYAKTYATIDPYIALEDEYPNIRMMLGRLYHVTGDADQAMASYDKILRDRPDHLDARRSAVGLLIDEKSYAAAQALVDEGLELYEEHPRMILLAGQLEAAVGRPKQALDFYKRALVRVSGDSDNSAFRETNHRIPGENDAPDLSTEDTSAINFLDSSDALALESAVGLREEILTAIGRVNANSSNFLQLGGQLRNRSGEAGLDKLTMFELPLKFDFRAGNSGRVSLDLVAESLNADDIQLSNRTAAASFGALALDTSLPRQEQIAVSENGLSLSLAYDTRYFNVDIGSTASDYAVTNAVGGISATNGGEDFNIRATLEQRALKESILSYAGQVDPFLGLNWGGVVKTGGGLRVLVDRQKQGFYGSISGHSLEGENVASNSVTQFGGGVFWRLKDTSTSELRVGLDIDSLSYDKNLGAYTFGHGGYFSPQNYLNIGVPIEWRGDTGPMQYLLTGKIGFERFEQEDSPYFPNDAALQLQLEDLAENAEQPLETRHKGGSNTGMSLSLRGEINYQVSAKLSLGSSMNLQRSGDYNESQIGLYARYYFSPQEVQVFAPAENSEQQLTVNRW